MTFNGNCAQALAFYEQVFGVKASEAHRYKDMPEGYPMPPGMEECIMHAQFELNGDSIMVCDAPPDMAPGFAGGVSIFVKLASAAEAKQVFDALKEGGEVGMELEQVFWSEAFGCLVDKFGVSWMISV